MTAAASASKMTVPQLREELKSKGLDATGLKAELVARLEASRSGGDDAGAPRAISSLPPPIDRRGATRGVASSPPRDR